jgi:hypothetical protein
MIIYDLNIENVAIHDSKAYAPLVVYANAPLTFAIATQRLQPIARRSTQIFKRTGILQHLQLAFGNSCEGLEFAWGFALEKCPGVLAIEGLDHIKIYNATR